MAPTERCHISLIDSFCHFLLFYPGNTYRLDQLALEIQSELNLLVKFATASDEIERIYEEQLFYSEPVHGEELMEATIDKLTHVFQQRIRAVEVRILSNIYFFFFIIFIVCCICT